MKLLKLAVVAMALVSGSAVLAFGQSAEPWLGTWKVNLAKSTYNPGPKPTTAQTAKLEAVQGGFKATFDGVDAKGQPRINRPPAILDGKDYPNPGQPNSTHSFTRIDSRSYERSVREDGKVTFTARWVASADGKTLTVTQKGKNPQVQTVSNVIVYDKQ